MTHAQNPPSPTLIDSSKGAAVYTKPVLGLYDLFILGLSSSFIWQCPSRRVLDLYNQHVTDKHLDVGVGTGYFLDRCRFPTTTPTIALLDLNPNCLQASAHRIRRYRPSCHVVDVLQPIDIDDADFGSIGINYLLHCLPGNLKTKSAAFAHLKPLLADGGVIFGSTILGEGVKRHRLANKLMRVYNAKGIFGNAGDRLEDLEAALKQHFGNWSIRVEGCVALFSASK
ncbi:MAG: class I SAM-dependent methyltransferase [Gammaproteobacteria bacterium]|nr:class I SAM-dependent methyltransferase [Gammaproteobacteria bacterium]